MFWEKFVKLCNSINKSPNAVCKELGFSSATATFWKRGSQPRDSAIQKVAEYFKVPTEYFSGNNSQFVNITKIRHLASEKGIKLSYLCSLCERQRGWLKDIELKGSDIPEEKLQLIANALGTTTEYLRDEKELSETELSAQELPPEHIQLIKDYSTLSKEQQEVIRKLIDLMLKD